jgi:lipopolysaccharide exporter
MAASQLVIVPFLMLVAFYFVRRHVPFRWSELFAAIWKSAIVTGSTVAGPIGVVALSDSGFDLSLTATAAAVLLAIMGWLAGIIVTRHPVQIEAKRAIDALLETPLVRACWRPRDRIIAYDPRTGEAR